MKELNIVKLQEDMFKKVALDGMTLKNAAESLGIGAKSVTELSMMFDKHVERIKNFAIEDSKKEVIHAFNDEEISYKNNPQHHNKNLWALAEVEYITQNVMSSV